MILRSLLYIIAVMLIIGWAVGYFIWRPGPLIHIMALFAAASFVLALSRKEGIR
ncbi:MAG: lmo0937 family membrane protein [Chitinophagaceae bacterium]|nr:lmo0937 family membrane protein [Chitinophagaceae bacterium]